MLAASEQSLRACQQEGLAAWLQRWRRVARHAPFRPAVDRRPVLNGSVGVRFQSFATAVAKGEVAREAVIIRWHLTADTPDNDRPARRKPGRARRASAKAPCPRRGTRRGSQAGRTGKP